MRKRIALTGPESSGKTSLARRLVQYFQVPLVDEFARSYLADKTDAYTFDDFLFIAGEQWRQRRKASRGSGLLFCDTDLLVLKIWAEVKYKKSLDWIDDALRKDPCELYLLCRPDIPWEEDPLRENPFDRERLFDLYLYYAKDFQLNFRVVEGDRPRRLRIALEAIASLG